MDITNQNHGSVVYSWRHCCKTRLFDHANNFGGQVCQKVLWVENLSEASLWLLTFLSWLYNHIRKKKQRSSLSEHSNLLYTLIAAIQTGGEWQVPSCCPHFLLFLLSFPPQSHKRGCSVLFFFYSVRLNSLLPLSGACAHEQSILLRFTEGWITRHNDHSL